MTKTLKFLYLACASVALTGLLLLVIFLLREQPADSGVSDETASFIILNQASQIALAGQFAEMMETPFDSVKDLADLNYLKAEPTFGGKKYNKEITAQGTMYTLNGIDLEVCEELFDRLSEKIMKSSTGKTNTLHGCIERNGMMDFFYMPL